MSRNLPLSKEAPLEANPDPLTGQAGAHPVATGIGAAAAGVAGLAASAVVAGPIGVAVATAGGAFIGAYLGKAIGEVIDPTAEEAFWREEHPKQEFADKEVAFDDYAPAYRVGYEGYDQHGGGARSFEDAEQELQEKYKGSAARMPWIKVRAASRAAWNRVHRGEAKRVPKQNVQTGVTGAVLSENADSLGNAKMPR